MISPINILLIDVWPFERNLLQHIVENDIKWYVSDVIRDDGAEIERNIRINVIENIEIGFE